MVFKGFPIVNVSLPKHILEVKCIKIHHHQFLTILSSTLRLSNSTAGRLGPSSGPKRGSMVVSASNSSMAFPAMAKCACSKRKNNVSTPNWVQTWQNFQRLQIRMHLTQTMTPTHYCTKKNWVHASWTIRVRFRSCNRCSGPTNLAANSGTFAIFLSSHDPKKPNANTNTSKKGNAPFL